MEQRKARKDYTCDFCGEKINAGEKYRFYKARGPRFIKGLQIGIEYWSTRHCGDEEACIDRHISMEAI